MVEFGIQLSHDLSKETGAPISKVISILLKNGIQAISIGANSGSAPPIVPNIFQWHDSANSNQTILTMLHPGGYGGVELKDVVMIDGFDHALVMAYGGESL